MKLNLYPLILLVAMACYANLSAQTTCTGETIKYVETFGKGGSSTSLPDGRTTYNYNSSSSLEDGDYKLYKNSQGRSEWHNASDHTGENNGRMMVINASYTAGEFYKNTVSNLEFNSFYTVYLYVMNTNTLGTCGSSAILPKLQFIVEYLSSNNHYTQLTSFVSAYIPQSASPTWVKIGGGFMLPAGITSVRYRILNNSSGGCGNDLAIDDITFSKCATQAILPIKGLKLNAELKNNAALINFSTESESNTLSFETEKSYDGKSWEVIHTQPAAGNSTEKRNYNVTDNNIAADVMYYRIKEIDIDGRFIYSPIVTLKRSETIGTKVTVYPNPFISNLSIEYKSQENEAVAIRLIDQAGRTLQSIPWNIRKGSNIIQLDNVGHLQTGFYIIEAKNASGKTIFSEKIIKK